MAHTNKVIRSINQVGEGLCVDIFQRPDGSFGFEEFRRDPEDPRGWYPIGCHSDAVFPTADDALQTALQKIAWLDDTL